MSADNGHVMLVANVARPEVMGGLLGVAWRCIDRHLLKNAGFSRRTAQTGATTLTKRPGTAPDAPVPAGRGGAGATAARR